MKYIPDTCLCIVEFDVNARGNLVFTNWIQKCQLHKNFDGQDLVDRIQALNKTYEIQRNPTREQIKQNLANKRAEHKRIRDMGAPVKH